MPKINCPECNKICEYAVSTTTIECPLCDTKFNPPEATENLANVESNSEFKEIVGLTLIYQSNHGQIDVSTTAKTILGRDNCGSDVLSKIYFNNKPVVSRIHCSIEYKDGKFYLQDEGSTNGTFCGDNKINCISAQIIEDKSLIFLGEELFQARFHYELQDESNNAQEENQTVNNNIPTIHRCNDPNCVPPFETENPPKVCPKCGGFDQFIPISLR